MLFCDLVGFTAASEAADPEDVRARLRPYHARLREEIERFGGTVEKFIGDAVMAVFGAPVAHEDDPERAVRAGLRILEAIGDLNDADPDLGLQVRVGINTGEAVVALGARPELGEGIVAGDVVNTASRLQGAAPVDAVAVSEQTYRQTERVFDVRAVAADRGERQVGAAADLPAPAGSGGVRTGRHSRAHDAAGRERSGDVAPDRDVRAGSAAAYVPAGDPGRRTRRGEEPHLRGASASRRRPTGPGQMAAGSLFAVRGRDRVLGVGRDREGRVRDPRVGHARAGRGEARAVGCGDRSGPRVAAGAAGAARRRAGRAGCPGGVVCGLAALLRGSRRRAADGAGVRGSALG